MKKYVVYSRVSTDKQGESGLGLKAQLDDAAKFTADGLVLEYFTEIESRSNSKRPVLDIAIKLAQKENAILIIAKLDRLTGDSLFLNQLLASELRFICCDNPEATPMVLRILAAVAQEEVEKTRIRTKATAQVIKNTIEQQGYYITKAGKVIYRLGTQKKFDNDEEKAEFYRKNASNRVYNKKSDIGSDLVKSLRKNGLQVPEIKERLASRGIMLSRATIYNYLK